MKGRLKRTIMSLGLALVTLLGACNDAALDGSDLDAAKKKKPAATKKAPAKAKASTKGKAPKLACGSASGKAKVERTVGGKLKAVGSSSCKVVRQNLLGLTEEAAETEDTALAEEAVDLNDDDTVDDIAPILVLAGLAVVSEIACIKVGSDQCRATAVQTCTGKGGRLETFKTICGAGTDLAGKMQLGYHCSISCK